MENEKSVIGVLGHPLAESCDSRCVTAGGRSPTSTHSERRSSLWRLALCGIFAALLAPAQSVFADYVGTKTIRMFVDPADLPVIQNGLQTGDQFRLIGEVTPGDTEALAVSGWNTFYLVPNGD
jgi:hypothetical protein